MADTNNWDFQNEHVQEDGVYDGKDYISSESTIVCAVPYEDGDLRSPKKNSNDWKAIGLLNNASVQQTKQIQNLYEIGSKKKFSLPGRTFGQLNVSRIMYFGPSLLKFVTAFNIDYSDNDLKASYGDSANFYTKALNGVNDEDGAPATGIYTGGGSVNQDFGGDNTTGGHFFINLASHFFNTPAHLGLLIHDSEDDAYGAVVLEDCLVRSHQMTFASRQTVVMENAQMSFNEVLPAKV